MTVGHRPGHVSRSREKRERTQPPRLPQRETLGADLSLSREVFALIEGAGEQGITRAELLEQLKRTTRPILREDAVSSAVRTLLTRGMIRWVRPSA